MWGGAGPSPNGIKTSTEWPPALAPWPACVRCASDPCPWHHALPVALRAGREGTELHDSWGAPDLLCSPLVPGQRGPCPSPATQLRVPPPALTRHPWVQVGGRQRAQGMQTLSQVFLNYTLKNNGSEEINAVFKAVCFKKNCTNHPLPEQGDPIELVYSQQQLWCCPGTAPLPLQQSVSPGGSLCCWEPKASRVTEV